MSLAPSGQLSLANIQGEFGGTNPIQLSEYYKGGSYVLAGDAAPNVQGTVGQPISLDQFHGAGLAAAPGAPTITPGYAADGSTANSSGTVTTGTVTASAVAGFWPAQAQGDDILVFGDEARAKSVATLHSLRQQLPKREGRSNEALSDFIAPRDSGLADYIGAFAVTAGIGEDVVAERFKRANDDYSAIMVKALADRLAEAFAERLHQRVRKEFWRYAADEELGADELIAEKYRGIRPAPGYPAQPDHTEKGTLFKLLGAERIGVKLTESFALWPGAAVCGLYFSHPQSHYFGVGKIERDQVEDYAKRKGWTIEECERWLAPILNYTVQPTPRIVAA